MRRSASRTRGSTSGDVLYQLLGGRLELHDPAHGDHRLEPGRLLHATCATIRDSWIHGTGLDPTSEWHASAVRVEQYATLVHNTLACDYTGPFNNNEIGCSADMSGYADFAAIHNNTIDGNLFMANPIGARLLRLRRQHQPASPTPMTRRTAPTSCSATTCSRRVQQRQVRHLRSRSPTSTRAAPATRGSTTCGTTAPPSPPADHRRSSRRSRSTHVLVIENVGDRTAGRDRRVDRIAPDAEGQPSVRPLSASTSSTQVRPGAMRIGCPLASSVNGSVALARVHVPSTSTPSL